MTNNTYALESKDSSSYEEGYQIFLKRSNFRECILSKFDELAVDIRTNSPLKVFDVGCGDGEMTKRYLQLLKTNPENIGLWLTEPAFNSLERAVDNLRKEATVVYAEDTFPNTQDFDLIIASYVFYHLTPDTLNNLSNQLKIHGSMAIMMGTSDNPFKTHPGLASFANHGSTDKLQPILSVLEQASNFKISRHKVETHLDLNGLKNDLGLTDEGKKLLGFSLNKDYSSLSEKALSAVDEIYAHAFEKNAGKVKSIHEIIWIQRLK